LHLAQRHAVVRALGSREARLHRAEIQFQRVRVFGVGRLVRAEQRVLLAVRLHKAHEAFVPACEAQVLQRALVDGEKAHRRAVLGRHVRNRRAVFHRQAAQARSVELHELVHHALLAQQLRHGQHQVGRCRAFGQLAREFDAHHLRDEHVVGLSQHHGFGFNPADAPAENAQRVNHRRVAVRADQRVGEGDHLAVHLLGLHHLAEILQVHLMHDACAWGHHAEAVERALRPA
jgi:hypothetical protein